MSRIFHCVAVGKYLFISADIFYVRAMFIKKQLNSAIFFSWNFNSVSLSIGYKHFIYFIEEIYLQYRCDQTTNMMTMRQKGDDFPGR